MMINANHISDLGVYTFELPSGNYMVNGTPMKLVRKQEVQVEDISDIRSVSSTSVVKHYVHVGEPPQEIISVENYDIRLKQLTSKGSYEDYEWSFDDLDDEFAYRRFKQNWAPVHHTITTESEPFTFDVSTGVLNTDNPFIASLYAMDGQSCKVYTYNRPGAIADILHKTFSELGMTYEDRTAYAKTDGKKIWGHSNGKFDLDYTMAFGTYLSFLKDYVKSRRRGSLEAMTELYNTDIEFVSRKIKAMFAAHFTRDPGTFDFSELYTKLQQINNGLRHVEYKVKSRDDYRSVQRKVTDAINFVDDYLQQEAEKVS